MSKEMLPLPYLSCDFKYFVENPCKYNFIKNIDIYTKFLALVLVVPKVKSPDRYTYIRT